jgi:Protein of unknown function (DUF2568)
VSGLRGVTLTVRFRCELAMLAALAYWGFAVGDAAGALAAAGLPLAAVVLGVVALATSLLNASQERSQADR